MTVHKTTRSSFYICQPIMHQRVRRLCLTKDVGERNTRNEATGKTILCALTLSSAVLRNEEELQPRVLQTGDRLQTEKKSERSERCKLLGFSYTLCQRIYLSPGVCSSLVAALLMCSVYFTHSDTDSWFVSV